MVLSTPSTLSRVAALTTEDSTHDFSEEYFQLTTLG